MTYFPFAKSDVMPHQ